MINISVIFRHLWLVSGLGIDFQGLQIIFLGVKPIGFLQKNISQVAVLRHYSRLVIAVLVSFQGFFDQLFRLIHFSHQNQDIQITAIHILKTFLILQLLLELNGAGIVFF